MFVRCLVSMIAGFALSAVAGCGTVANFKDDPKIYGGVQFDADMVHAVKSDEKMVKSLSAIYALDMPLSLVADTLTLPVVVPVAFYNSIKEEKK